jgi:hypothetical protein
MLKSNVEIQEQKLVDETVGEHIGYDLGVKMVKDYFDKFGEGGAQFVGKNIIQDIISQPGCIGINIYKALNEAGAKTYVLVGLDKENNPILNYSAVNIDGQIRTKEGIVADRNFGLGWFDELIS